MSHPLPSISVPTKTSRGKLFLASTTSHPLPAVAPAIAALWVLLLTVQQEAVMALEAGNNWIRVADNARYVNATNKLWVGDVTSAIMCSALCKQNSNCVAFNYCKMDGTCEVLSTPYLDTPYSKLTNGTGWSYYSQRWMLPDPCLSSPCPANKYWLSYSGMLFQRFNYSLAKYYICSAHRWFASEAAGGKKSCHLVTVYMGDNPTSDSLQTWSPVTYYAALDKCITTHLNCVALVYNFKWEKAWLKDSTHWMNNLGIDRVNPDFIYMYPVCQ